MTRLLIAAMSGFGKSYVAQAIIERNIPDHDQAVVFDYKDEYRGLVKEGLLKQAIVGPNERNLSVDDWRRFLAANPKVNLVKHRLTEDEWADVAAKVVRVVREMEGDGLIALDEAHSLAPQTGTVPDSIAGLAKTGRGEGVTSMWITQELQSINNKVISQRDEQVAGGFREKADRGRLSTEYPEEVHDPVRQNVPALPPELQVDGENVPLRRFEDDDENTIGSEWVFSDDQGNLQRWDTRTWSPNATHYGPEGNSLEYPGGGE